MNFNGKLGLQQRALPSYRVPFFDLLAERCERGMSLFAGQPRPAEMIAVGKTRIAQYAEAENVHLLNGRFYFCYQKGFIRWLEESQPDALILEANPRYLSAPAAVRWMRRRGRKVVGWGLGAPKQNAFWKQFIRQFDGMLAYSQRGADEYAALGFLREKIFVAHNSVSPAPTFNPQPSTFNLQSSTLNLHPTTLNPQPAASILFVGRLQARKRVDSLIRACAEMESKPQLVVVGEGPEKGALQKLAREVYPSTEFVGAKHGADLIPYFQHADLFVLPGTGGLAVQEAMSYGLPIIVAKGDGTQDDLVREKNGWQITPEDYGALVAALKNALTDRARLREMGKESFRIVAEEINIQRMADVFVEALNAVAK
ncbi:MAG: glycosyltransferase family 4 protein [Anaerolineales bacterium]|nr:glycosyltransferase family 4 protein [Anaerolineales bacterium]